MREARPNEWLSRQELHWGQLLNGDDRVVVMASTFKLENQDHVRVCAVLVKHSGTRVDAPVMGVGRVRTSKTRMVSVQRC